MFPNGKMKPITSLTRQAEVSTTLQLGAYVRAVREEAGLDQATAAGLAGVGTRFLGDLERGKSSVRLGLVLQVLERLGLALAVHRRGAKNA